jgi:hypothetical protein
MKHKFIPNIRDVPNSWWAKIEISNDHWLWNGFANKSGYGIVNLNDSKYYAHRVFYTIFIDSIPEGLHIDHLCRVRNCVNPAHLEAVTQLENNMRIEGNLAVTERHNSYHAKNKSNFYIAFGGGLRCKECRKEYMRRYRLRKKQLR